MEIELIERANALLDECVNSDGPTIGSIEDLQRGSVFVYLFETLFERPVKGINRYPRNSRDYMGNLECVLVALSPIFAGDDLCNAVNAEEIVSGNLDHISQMLWVFESIVFETNTANDDDAPTQATKQMDEMSSNSIDGDDDDSLSSSSSSSLDDNDIFEDSSSSDDHDDKQPPFTNKIDTTTKPTSKLLEQRQAWEHRVERIKLTRLQEDLQRAAESHRLDRMDASTRLTKKLIADALKAERERIAAEAKLVKERREARDRAELAQLEAAKQVYRNRYDLLQEHLEQQKQLERTERRNATQELRALQREWKQDFTKQANAHKQQLEGQYEKQKYESLQRIQRAFEKL